MGSTATRTEQVSTRDVPPLSMRAAIRPGSVDTEARTAEVVWTTGARVLRGFYDKFHEELSLDPKHVRMERLASGRAPLLNSHSSYDLSNVLGVVESARIEKKQGVAVIRFAKAEDDPEADKIFRKVADGIITNISVGYRVHRFEKVEGGEEKIPVFRAVDWEPYELSLVGMPADPGAGVRSADGSEMAPCTFVRWKETEMGNIATNPAVDPEGSSSPPAPVPSPAPSPDEASRAAVENAIRIERERVTGIRAAVRLAKLGDDFADRLISEGTGLDAARAQIFDQLATASEQVRTDGHIRVGEDEKDKWHRGAAAWLFSKAAVTDALVSARKAQPDHEAFRDLTTDPGEFRGMSLVDLARECLERAGVRTRGLSKMDLVGRALTHRTYAATSDFAVLLESAMHKVLLAAYATTPDTWSRFCAVGSVSDFRVHNRYRLGSFGVLDALNEHGEFKNKEIPDGEKSTISVGTKGNIIGLTRQAIINDDMGAFNSLATRFGRAARLSIEVDVYALLALNAGLGPTQGDGQPLFHANRANVGTGSVLSVEGLDGDRVVMGAQKDPAGNEILDLRPAVLLVSSGLGGQARVINDAQYDPDTSGKLQRPNMVRGLFRDIVDTARITGTRRYLLADPSVAPVFEVAFLEGQREPYMESQDGWRVDGTEWKVRLDYGVAAVDYRGAVTNAGAS